MKTLDRCVLTAVVAVICIYLVYSITSGISSTKEEIIRNIHKKIDSFVYKASDELARRAYRVNHVCGERTELMKYTPKLTEGIPDWMYMAFLVNDERSMLYCPVPKCGWTSWRTMFFQVYGPPDSDKILQDMNRTGWMSPWDKVGLTPHSLFEGDQLVNKRLDKRMIFVRNPYDRLVSAYRDKVERDAGVYVKRTKHPCKWIKPNSPKLTFSQFIQCIIDNAKEHSNNNLESFDAGEALDMHWRPQSLLCNVCKINYNIVGHFDRMSSDMKAALDMLDMKTTVEWGNQVEGSKKSLTYWYEQLSAEQIQDLQKIYKYDFEIFSFDKIPPT